MLIMGEAEGSPKETSGWGKPAARLLLNRDGTGFAGHNDALTSIALALRDAGNGFVVVGGESIVNAGEFAEIGGVEVLIDIWQFVPQVAANDL